MIRTSKKTSTLYLCVYNLKSSSVIFSGLKMPIYAIMEGKVTPYILDKNFEQYLPVIPSEVSDERYEIIIIIPTNVYLR